MTKDLDQIAEFGKVETIKEDIPQMIYTNRDIFIGAAPSKKSLSVLPQISFVAFSNTSVVAIGEYVWEVDEKFENWYLSRHKLTSLVTTVSLSDPF